MGLPGLIGSKMTFLSTIVPMEKVLIYYPNRFYHCLLIEGRYIYTKEEACPSGECYNGSKAAEPLKCDITSCAGKFFPEDRERNCPYRPPSEGRSMVHPTDLTRQFSCWHNGAVGWDFQDEWRCGYGECVDESIMYQSVATGNRTVHFSFNCSTSACSHRGDNHTPLSPATVPQAIFPDMPDDYLLWDDMLVPKDLKKGATSRNAVANKFRLWPSQTIPYYIDESLEKIRPMIYSAMKDFHQKTCILFVPWTPVDREYIYIFLGDGCYSFVGDQQTKGQLLSLNPSCKPSVGVIIHELNHAVGFYHEHTRSDRDQFLDILWENITPGQESNWDKLPSFGNILFYNFTTDTVMIYSSLSGSKDGVNPTMVDKSGKELPNIEKWTSMSADDAWRINALYGCPQPN